MLLQRTRIQSLLLPLVLLIPGAVWLWNTFILHSFLYADSGFYEFQGAQSLETFSLIQFATNAFYRWRFDPILFGLIDMLFGNCRYGFEYYLACVIVLFTIGTYLWLQEIQSVQCENKLLTPFLAVLFSLVLLILFGADSTVFGVMLWYPWFCWSLVRLESVNSKRHDTLAGFLTGLLFVLAANQLALPFLFGSCIFLQSSRDRKAKVTLVLVPLAVLALANSSAIELPNYPDYPAYTAKGHVVPYDGGNFGSHPLVGNEPPLITIDRVFLRESYSFPAMVLLLFSLISFLGVWLASRGRASEATVKGNSNVIAPPLQYRFGVASTLLGLVLLLDTSFLSATDNFLAPLQNIAQILPGLFVVPLAPYCFLLGFFCLFSSLSSVGAPGRVLLCIFLGALCFSSGNRHVPLFTSALDVRPWRELQEISNSSNKKYYLQRLLSPSYGVIKRSGLQVFEQREALETLQFQIVDPKSVEADASINSDELDNIFDNKEMTRWSNGGGGQKGTEWVKFRFHESRRIRAVRLLTGAFYTDFPRGIEVKVLSNCVGSESVNSDGPYELVSRIDRTDGELVFSALGYPYLSEQFNVSVIFPEERQVQCLLIRQISTESHYDWSIAEIALAEGGQ